MQKNNGDMIVESSTYFSFESSASTLYFQYIVYTFTYMSETSRTVCVYWVRG